MAERGTPVSTDLHSLREDLSPPPLPTLRYGEPEPEARSFSDQAIDFLIPCMIFTMMLAVTWFLLDIRFVFTERLDANMRMFAFFFVLGIVALNRLRAERGLMDSAGYMGGLVFAVGAFTVVTQLRGGGMTGGYVGSMALAMCFNIAAVVILWKVTDRLTRDCCVDDSGRDGEEGILSGGGWWRRGKTAPEPPTEGGMNAPDTTGTHRPPRRHPANSLFYFAIPIMGLLAMGQRLLPQGGSFLQSAGSVYVGVYTASMLMLLLLSSYRGIRVYCQRKEIAFPTSIAAFWLGLGAVMVVLVFVLGLWGPVPPTPEAAERYARTYAATGRTMSDQWDYHEHERTSDQGNQQPSGENSDERGGEADPNAAEGPHEGEEQEAQREQEQRDQEGQQTQREQQGQQGQQEQPGSQGGQQGQQEQQGQQAQPEQQSRQEQQGRRQSGGRSPQPPRAEIPMNQLMAASPILKWLGIGVLVVVGLFALYALLQAAAHFLGRASGRRGSRFARLFDRLARLFRKLTHVPKRKQRRAKVKIDRDIATCSRYQNPLNGPMALREKIQYSYDALCALAYDLGVPRDDDQTPFEFLAQLPEPIEDLRAEADALTHLYVAGSYSTLHIPDDALEALRAFWRRYERMRARVVH